VRGIVDVDGSITRALGGPAVLNKPPSQLFIGGNGFVGNFIGSAQPALNSNQCGGESYEPGFRVTLGYRFKEGFEVEFNYAHREDSKEIGGATSAAFLFQNGPALANSFLFSPVWNFPPLYAGPPNKVAVGNPYATYGIWDGASEMTTNFEQHYDEYNLGGRVPIVEDDCNRCYGLVGMRHVWFWEVFRWRTVAFDQFGNAGPQDAAWFQNIVSNPMYGPYLGAGYECYLGHGFSVALDVNGALMVDFVRELAHWERADYTTEAKRSKREYTLCPEAEAQLNLWWYPCQGVQIKAGYDFKAFFNTIGSPYPVSFDFDAVNPAYQHIFWRMVDGWTAGIGFIF
jgi:hypothetical protein